MPRNYVPMNNFQKQQLLEEHKRIQKNCEQVNLLGSADWAKEKFKLKKLPSKQAISRFIRNESKIQEEINDYKFKRKNVEWQNVLNFKNSLLNGCGKCMAKMHVQLMN